MLWIVALGIATGARAMTGIAVLCWAAHLGFVPLEGTWAFWMGNIVSVVIFTLAALGEYFGDTRPNAPSRASAGAAIARFAFATLIGAAAATAVHEPIAGGVLAAWIGCAIGTYGGVRVRIALAKLAGRDLPVALAESALMIVFALWGVRGLHRDVRAETEHAQFAPAATAAAVADASLPANLRLTK